MKLNKHESEVMRGLLGKSLDVSTINEIWEWKTTPKKTVHLACYLGRKCIDQGCDDLARDFFQWIQEHKG